MKHLNITIEQYEKNTQKILGSIVCVINETDRIAMTGPNGAGKSTFMKIISGEIQDFDGTVENVGNMTLGYLEQIHFLDDTISVRDELRNAFVAIRELENLIQQEEIHMEKTGECEAYTEYIEQMNILGGYTYENEIERVARGIGIFHLLEKPLSNISGGERTKVALAKILLLRPEFLLLDEPTNFIDLAGVEWLEKYLLDTWKGGYLIISHDREFLDETCNQVIDMLGENGIQMYTGSYSNMLQEKKKVAINYEKKYDEQQQMLAETQKLINRFRAGSRSGWAKSKEKALERIEKLAKPIFTRKSIFLFPFEKHPPEVLFKIEDAFIGRKDPLFFIRDITFNKKDRIGIIGENGVGKSTFVKTLLHQIRALEGVVQIHGKTKILFFSQLHESLQEHQTVAESFVAHGLQYTPSKVGGLLEGYGLDYMDHLKKISALSGGERSRVLFAILGQFSSNLLILDEPTNHLDADTREALENALESYPGALLFISHDRYFVNKIATKIWIIEDGELSISYGNYEDYQFKKERGIHFDIQLFDLDGEMDIVLEEKLGILEARRIKEKFARKKARRHRK